jgi:dephospho-CoA kinase
MTSSPQPAQRFALGLTGGIGSGKSSIADLFAELGADIIDTDQIAHQLTASGGAAIATIAETFGAEFILPSGALDRQKMREAVFSTPDKKHQLEAILHPLIRAECERLGRASQAVYPIFVVPLLVESGNWAQRVSRILVVDCLEETQIQRVMQRNHLSREQVQAIMRNQATRAQRLAHADDVILNEGALDHLRQQIDTLHRLYCKLATQ